MYRRYDLVASFELRHPTIKVFPRIAVEKRMELKNDYMTYLASPELQYIPGNFDGSCQKQYEALVQRCSSMMPNVNEHRHDGKVLRINPSNTIFAPTVILIVEKWNFDDKSGCINMIKDEHAWLKKCVDDGEWQVHQNKLVVKGCVGTRSGSFKSIKGSVEQIASLIFEFVKQFARQLAAVNIGQKEQVSETREKEG